MTPEKQGYIGLEPTSRTVSFVYKNLPPNTEGKQRRFIAFVGYYNVFLGDIVGTVICGKGNGKEEREED